MSNLLLTFTTLARPNTPSTPGKDLLHALRSRDKLLKDDGEVASIHQEILDQLTLLNVLIERNGLFSFSDGDKIRSLFQETSGATTNGGGKNEGGKKRKRKERNTAISAAQYGIYLDSNSQPLGEKVDLEEGKLLMGICKIIGVNSKDSGSVDIASGGWLEKVQAACELLTSICGHASQNGTSFIVRDMIGSITAPLLDGLCRLISTLEESYSRDGSASALVSAMEAATSIISLVQTRCSQNKAGEKVLHNLRTVVWSLPNSINDRRIIKAAAGLLASLPLAGDTNNTPLAVIWSTCVKEGINLIQLAVNNVFPVTDKDKQTNLKSESNQNHQEWINSLKDSLDNEATNNTIDSHRTIKFLSRIQCLSQYLAMLIKCHGYPKNTLVVNNYPLQSLLDTSEMLLSFPLAVEIAHRSLSSRLHSSPVNGGLISPNAAVSIAANIRYFGHTLFDATIASCRAGVMSKARQIISIVMGSLQYVISNELLSVVEGRKRGSTGRKKEQFRNSILLRLKAVEMFRGVVLALGVGVMSSSLGKTIFRGVILVGGCLLEQVQRGCGGSSDDNRDEEWGTNEEKCDLIETCSNTLSTCLTTLGGLIPNNVRGTIDSIILTCLSSLHSVGSRSYVFTSNQVKQSLLQLGMNSVCMPWGDGGRSTLLGMVRTIASMLRSDPNISVASAALSTLCALDAIVTPRAPAFLIPSRESVNDSVNTLSAEDILEGIKSASVEVSTAAVDTEQRKTKKTVGNKNKSAALSTNGSTEEKITSTPHTEKVTSHTNNKNDKPAPKPVKLTNSKSDTDKEPADLGKGVETNDLQVSENRVKSEAMGNHSTQNHVFSAEESGGKGPSDKGDTKQQSVEFKPPSELLGKKDDSSDDDSSLGDFPEIIDEDPDEEDR